MKNSILENEYLFVKYPDYARGIDLRLYQLRGTDYYFVDVSNGWIKKIEYTESNMSFEDIFSELVADKNISNQVKELILFNLVELRNLGR